MLIHKILLSCYLFILKNNISFPTVSHTVQGKYKRNMTIRVDTKRKIRGNDSSVIYRIIHSHTYTNKTV